VLLVPAVERRRAPATGFLAPQTGTTGPRLRGTAMLAGPLLLLLLLVVSLMLHASIRLLVSAARLVGGLREDAA